MWRNRIAHPLSVGTENGTGILENSLGISLKKLYTYPAVILLAVYLREMKSDVHIKSVYNCSFICNSSKPETTKMSLYRGLVKQ